MKEKICTNCKYFSKGSLIKDFFGKNMFNGCMKSAKKSRINGKVRPDTLFTLLRKDRECPEFTEK